MIYFFPPTYLKHLLQHLDISFFNLLKQNFQTLLCQTWFLTDKFDKTDFISRYKSSNCKTLSFENYIPYHKAFVFQKLSVNTKNISTSNIKVL